MSKKQGMFRRIFDTARKAMGLPVTHHYPDPVARVPKGRRRGVKRFGRKNDVRPMLRRGHLGPPKCEPGTITYHDKLVRHFGHREALRYRRCLIAKQPELLPTPEDFRANPPWAWRNQ
jgi:hypothetical protein